MTVTKEKLDAATDAVLALRKSLELAVEERIAILKEYNAQELAAKGIIQGETICVAKAYRWDKYFSRCIAVVDPYRGDIKCRVLTKKNTVNKARNPFTVTIDGIEPEVRS